MLRHQQGFTLTEVLMTILIGSILMIVAIPGFNSAIQNNRTISFANEFYSSVSLARVEAIRRGTPVTICAASDTTQTACGVATDWGNGWIIFIDPDSNGVIAVQSDRVRIHEALPIGSSITTAQARVTYETTGLPSVGVGTYNLQATGCVGNNARDINVNIIGRLSIDDAAC